MNIFLDLDNKKEIEESLKKDFNIHFNDSKNIDLCISDKNPENLRKENSLYIHKKNEKYLKYALNNGIKYIKKPFNSFELLSIIKTFLEQKEIKLSQNYIYKNNSLYFKNEELVLSKNEKLVFSYLIKNINKTISSQELKKNIWIEEKSDITLRTLIHRLKAKLKEDIINSFKGSGYKISTIKEKINPPKYNEIQYNYSYIDNNIYLQDAILKYANKNLKELDKEENKTYIKIYLKEAFKNSHIYQKKILINSYNDNEEIKEYLKFLKKKFSLKAKNIIFLIKENENSFIEFLIKEKFSICINKLLIKDDINYIYTKLNYEEKINKALRKVLKEMNIKLINQKDTKKVYML